MCRAIAGPLPPGLVLDGELLAWDADRGRTAFGQLRRRVTAGRGIDRPRTGVRPAWASRASSPKMHRR
ncbi:hypothetical protein Sya03_57730 [Spirilliplanes yamanashiensis]|uniref:ATP-dependent DNA ligase family profile domain-containing protein n=1 Tax=Spirilliplanes yamanashiensis TaxID=42233 RepID=A0A8J3YCV4_9ACTN|nr:hypothetical protein Sya03_57730 [Spirilliplanes yamanashiensis]